MDPAAIASAIGAAGIAKAQLAVAARLARTNAVSQHSLAALIEAANASLDRATKAALPSNLGGNLDVSA